MDIQQMIDDWRPTLVEVFASGDTLSVEMAPMVEQLRIAYEGRAHVAEYEGNGDKEVDRVFDVKSFPTWILYKEGKEMWRSAGRKESWELEDILDKYL